MGKLLTIFKVFLLVGIVAFTSCTKEEPIPVLDLNPVLNILEEEDCVSGDVTLDVKQDFKLKIWSAENPYTKNQLEELKIIRVFKMQAWDTTFQIEGPNLWLSLNFCAQFSTGEEAFERYKLSVLSNDPFDALILDLTIVGGMGGERTMRKILDFHPAARGIVSSGYSNNPVMENPEKYGFVSMLVKPFVKKRLVEALQRVLKTEGDP